SCQTGLILEQGAFVVPRAQSFGAAKRCIECVVQTFSRTFCGAAEVHCESRRDEEIAADLFDTELVQLTRQQHAVFVVKRRIASRDVEIAVDDTGCFVEHTVSPNARGEAMIRTESSQRDKRGREFHRRGWIELIILC